MANIAKSDVVIDMGPRNIEVFRGGRGASLPTIKFGGADMTYPSGGVPLPDIGQFGFKRQMDRLLIQQPVDPKLTYRYDPSEHTIRIYTAEAAATTNIMVEVAENADVAATEIPAVVIGE